MKKPKDIISDFIEKTNGKSILLQKYKYNNEGMGILKNYTVKDIIRK